jgi:hypothetical protein
VKLAGFSRLLSGEVVLLAEIVAQAIELAAAVGEELDQLPVSHAKRSRRRAALRAGVRVVPVESFPIQPGRRITQQRRQVNAVHMLLRLWRQTGEGQDRWIQIGADDRLVRDAAGTHQRRIMDNPRHAVAPFIAIALAESQRRVVRDVILLTARVGVAAVVGRENHDGPLQQAALAQSRDDPGHARIETLDHCRVRRIEGLAFALGPRLMLLHEIRPPLNRRVDGVIGLIQEERLVLLLLDELHGLIGQAIGEVLSLFRSGQVHAVGQVIAAGRASRVWLADGDVEALLPGPVGRPAQMPLADQTRRVSGGPQRFGQRRFRQRQMIGGRRAPFAAQPVGESQSGGILAGHQTGPCRRTDAAGRISGCEAQPA